MQTTTTLGNLLGPDDFLGRWRLRREITDHRLRQTGDLEGDAVLSRATDGMLDYAEAGELRYGDGPPMEASRAYRWHFVAGAVEVFFSDGRPFHSFEPAGHVEGTDHPCGADLYRVRYDFTRWPNWIATWAVKGPRKDYTAVSTYAQM